MFEEIFSFAFPLPWLGLKSCSKQLKTGATWTRFIFHLFLCQQSDLEIL